MNRTWLMRAGLGVGLLIAVGVVLYGTIRPAGDDRQAARPAPEEPTGSRSKESNSADRMIFWTGCDDVVSLSDSELERWKRRGVDGFVCQVRHLRGLGGSQDFTGDASADLRGANYNLQRRLRDSDVVKRARRRGIKTYLGFYAVNPSNRATPFAGWFDDRGWSDVVLPRVREIAAAARRLGFAGLAVDQELYANESASWDWDYPGNRHPEAEVRANVKERGAELMRAMVRSFPGLELVAYDTQLPQSWEELVQERINNVRHAFDDDVQINLWDGISGVHGYRAIRWMDAIFYKTPHIAGASWDTALQYNANRIYSLLSRRFSGWSYASSRLYVSPFAWIDKGQSEFEAARPPGYVAEQLAAFRKWGTGEEFANYAYGGLHGFDYGPYLRAMRAASTPGRVDSKRPGLSITARSRSSGDADRLDLQGFATDNLAIRAVRWRDDRGRTGTAKLRWIVDSGDAESGWKWRMKWWVRGLRVPGGATKIWVRAEDIKGLATVRSIRIPR